VVAASNSLELDALLAIMSTSMKRSPVST